MVLKFFFILSCFLIIFSIFVNYVYDFFKIDIIEFCIDWYFFCVIDRVGKMFLLIVFCCGEVVVFWESVVIRFNVFLIRCENMCVK